jgi:seryl-tRNA synthetase
MTTFDAAIIQLKSDAFARREKWRTIRGQMLRRKRELLSSGFETSLARKDREYRLLRKEKKRLSKEIRHLEQKINKKQARLANEK